MDAKKIILKFDLHDDGDKQKVMKAVSKISGIDSITMNMKEMKLTVVGDIDPVIVVNKLRKNWNTSIFFVGPAKEPEKKKDEKKDDKKGDTKDDKKKDEGKKEGSGDKKKDSNDHMAPYNPYIMPYYNYPPHIVTHNPHMNYPSHIVTHNPHMYYPQHATTQYPPMATTPYYSHEENPNSCVIC